jgi:two-component system sensor histidine kinase CpxA
LFARIFLSFWLAMTLIVLIAVITSARLIERRLDQVRDVDPTRVLTEAAAVLREGGRDKLEKWLRKNTHSLPGVELFVIDPKGFELLEREVPARMLNRLQRFARVRGEPPRGLRPARPSPQLVGPDGELYTVLTLPRRPTRFGVLQLPGVPLTVLLVALAVSGIVCWWLARYLSRPLRHLQTATREVAHGQLDVRPGRAIGHRRDEIGQLSRDFDRMATALQRSATTQKRMLRDISHELRSPLARLQVALELARRKAPQADAELDRIAREADRLNALIGQVLDLARLEGRDAPVEFETVDVAGLLAAVAGETRLEAEARNVEIALQLEPGINVLANPNLLASALENILRNAVIYTEQDSVVDIVMRADSSVEIDIGDRGPGVPDSELEKIFQPFHRVESARERHSGGEGVGLAIAARVADIHGGSISAANRDAGGLRIRMTLPRKV